MIEVKGVSAIIAIILILMIVVSLAALVYTWFQGIFGSLFLNVQTSEETSTEILGTKFKIELAENITGLDSCCNISVTLKNIGTNKIDLTKISAYVDGEKKIIYNQPSLGNLAPDEIATINVSSNEDTTNKRLKIADKTGFEQITTIT